MSNEPGGPFRGFQGAVQSDWIDSNGHMNVGWYDHVFDVAESRLFEAFGVDEGYIARTRHGMFRVEKRIRYEKELLLGDALRIDSRILSSSGRVLRHAHELCNLTRGGRAAIAEYVSLHVDLSLRKSVPISDAAVTEPLRRLAEAHQSLPPIAGI